MSVAELSQPIIFYDFPSKKKGANAWSGNTWKTRYSLNYKGLAYKTVWVEYHQVESTLKAIGIPPTTVRPDGTPRYTLPAIVDPNTGTAIAESFQIAEYLDKTYPDKPTTIPAGSGALQKAFIDACFSNVLPLFPFALYEICENLLNPESQDFYRAARKNDLLRGVSIADAYPRGDRAEEEWAKVEAGFGKMAKWMSEDGAFVMGNTISFADFVLGGFLQLAVRIWGKDSQEWKDISSWDGGRWGRLHEALEKYETVV